jgi:hypothetical protein
MTLVNTPITARLCESVDARRGTTTGISAAGSRRDHTDGD